ncbi:hypothetical protein OKW18_002489 [Streptomyces pratensis]|nr:hypothetical protein [Streptomyces pratensis]
MSSVPPLTFVYASMFRMHLKIFGVVTPPAVPVPPSGRPMSVRRFLTASVVTAP